MFIPLDAAYNRCRPVPPWNGSSSASLRPPATTRCSKAYNKSRSSLRRCFPLFAGALFLVPAAVASLPAQPIGPSRPEVVNLTLNGVEVVRKDELERSIYTTASHCNSFILKPFCWISKAKYFYTKKYLDHRELGRDVLRIRI